MLAPIILFAFYIWVPLIECIWLSVHSAKGTVIQEFVGLQNYKEVIFNPLFTTVIKNTFQYILWSLLVGFAMPILMALVISETVGALKGFFRVAVYVPNIVPGIAAALVWRYFFKADSTGVLNILLGKVGGEPVGWLTSTTFIILLIIIVATWKGAGSTALIYMAGISNISSDIYEATSIDGANVLQRIRYVTIPSVVSLAKSMLVLQVIAVFQILHEPLVITNGGPINSSMSVMQLVYNYAFRDFKYPQASALSVIICLILVCLSGLYMKITRSQEE